MSLGSSTVVSSPDVAVEAMPPVVQLIPCTACLFFFFLLTWTRASSVSPDVSIAQSGCVYLALASAHYIFSPLLSVPLLPPRVPDLSISLCHPSFPLYSIFLSFIPSIFCPSTPLAQPSSPCLNFRSSPRGTAVEQTAVPYQTPSDTRRDAERQRWVTSPRQQSTHDA